MHYSFYMAKVLLLKSDCLPHQSGCCLPYSLSAFMLCLLNLHKIKHKKQLAEQVCSLRSLFSVTYTNRSFHNNVCWILPHSYQRNHFAANQTIFTVPSWSAVYYIFSCQEQLKKNKTKNLTYVDIKLYKLKDPSKSPESPSKPNLDTLKLHLH